jgi:MFS family permease
VSPNSGAATASGPWRSLSPVFLACLAFGVQAGASVPLALAQRGVDNLVIGLIGASWGVGMIATASYIPALAARFGAVPLMCASAVIGAAISVAFAFTDSVPLWFALTTLHGAVGGVPWVVSEIWINVVVDEKRRGRVVAVYSTLIAVGLAIGPLVLQVVGVYGPVPFLVCAAIMLAVTVPLLPAWKSAPPIAPVEGSGTLIVVLAAPVAFLAVLASGLGEQAAFSFLPIFAVEAGVSAETGALWLSAFVIGNLALQWPIGWAADHLDRRAVLAACALASAALVASVTALDPRGLGILGVLVLWGGISFGIYTVGLALLGQRFRGGDIARANAAFTIVYTVGGLVGRPIAGGAMDAIGRSGLTLTLAFFYALAGVAALLAFHRRG